MFSQICNITCLCTLCGLRFVYEHAQLDYDSKAMNACFLRFIKQLIKLVYLISVMQLNMFVVGSVMWSCYLCNNHAS